MVGYLELSINFFFPEQLSCKHWFELLITINRNVAETSLFSSAAVKVIFSKPATGQFIIE